MASVERLKALYRSQPLLFQGVAGGVASLLICSLVWLISPGADVADRAEPTPPRLDTAIPEGFVLVPIEVQNLDALDSVLGPYGIVDLYESGFTGRGSGRRLARGLKILRSPQNPRHFAVLVPEDKAADIVGHGAPVFVVVQNRNKVGMEFESKKRLKSRIEVEFPE